VSVKEQAVKLWGDRWLVEITRVYCQVTGEGDVSHRKAQIKRVFENCKKIEQIEYKEF
jgi:hypothetical protein